MIKNIRREATQKTISLLLLVFILAMSLCFSMVAKASGLERMVDFAGLLTTEDKQSIENRLSELSEKYSIDMVIVLDDDASVTDATDYADTFIDYNGYGVGDDKSVQLLYLNVTTRDWQFSAKGYGSYAFTDEGERYMADSFLQYCSDGDFYKGFSVYLDMCESYLEQAQEGDPYDVGNMPKDPFPFVRNLVIAIIIGLVVAWIYVTMLKGQMNTVHANDSAKAYLVEGSLHLTGKREFFLYKTVTKTKKEEQQSSGGGSATRTASSGETHTGIGGKF